MSHQRKIVGEMAVFVTEAFATDASVPQIQELLKKNYGKDIHSAVLYRYKKQHADRIEKCRMDMERSFKGIAQANVYNRIKTRNDLVEKIQKRIEKKEAKEKLESFLSDARSINLILDSIQREFVVINEIHAKDVYYDVLDMTEEQFQSWLSDEYEGQNLSDVVPRVIYPDEKEEIRQAREEIKKEMSGNEQYVLEKKQRRATVIRLPKDQHEKRGRPRKYFRKDYDQKEAIKVSKRIYAKRKAAPKKISQRNDEFREKFLKKKITPAVSPGEKPTGTK